ncbi:hypothetical protein NU219Hw_g4772t1 [Hortaea werneckii]
MGGFSLFKRIPRAPSDTAADGRTGRTATTLNATPSITADTTKAGSSSGMTPTANAQALGSVIGTFDIRCTLEGRRSKWAPKWCLEDGLQGALYFELQFVSNRPHDALLETATVRIRFGPPENSEPVPCVFTHAPINGISGPPMTHTQEQYSTLNPQAGVNAAGFGVNLGGYERGKGMESMSTRSWEFTSGKPSRAEDSAFPAAGSDTAVTDVDFTWIRGWDDDYDGLNRTFRAAVIINRDVVKDVAMTVFVEARAKHIWHQALAPREKRSRYLHPIHNTNPDAFEDLLQNLETTVEADNYARMPRGTAEQSGAIRGASSSADLYGSETLLPSPAQQPYQPALPPGAPHSQLVTPVMSPVSANTAANQ